MATVLRELLAVVMFGPFLVSLGFLWYSLRHGQKERLCWQVPGLVANLFLGIGFAMIVLWEQSVWAWVGVAFTLAASAVSGWLSWAEHKEQQTQNCNVSL